MRWGLVLMLVVVFCAARTATDEAAPLPSNSITAPKPKAVWRSDFSEAEVEAKRLGLPLLVHFSAEWCGPCRRMEQEVLHSAALYRQLEGRFIAVKVDSDQHPDLVQRFGIESLPSDLFLGADGTILARSSSYQDSQSYLAQIARVDSRVAQSRKVQMAADAARKSAPQAPANPAGVGKPGEQVQKSSGPELKAQDRPAPGDNSVPVKRPSWLLGLRGYSPVALMKSRKWVMGDSRFAWEHKGIVYYCASAGELDEFREQPERFAPQLQGCDPVILEERDRAVVGDTRFGVFYQGELYFFVNPESRARFKTSPQRYTKTKHVLNVKKIEPTEVL